MAVMTICGQQQFKSDCSITYENAVLCKIREKML